MKTLIIALIMLLPILSMGKEPVKTPWAKTSTHKTITRMTKHQVKKSCKYKAHKKARSLKRLKRKWESQKY